MPNSHCRQPLNFPNAQSGAKPRSETKMKKLLLLAISIACIASAAPLCSGVISPTFTCTIGSVTFDSFQIVSQPSAPVVLLMDATQDAPGHQGEIVLDFNPQMHTSAGQFASFWFYFNVSGGISGIDLSVGGTNAAISEKACSTAIDPHAANNCMGGSGNLLANLAASSSESTQSASFANTSKVYVFKDVVVGSSTQTGELTSFSQSFTVGGGQGGGGGGQIPEPASFFTMGSGLIVAGILLKSRRRKV